MDRAGFRHDDVVSCQVLALPQRCYRCGAITRSVVGVVAPGTLTFDHDGFVPFAEVAEDLAARLEHVRLVGEGVGRLRWRRSRQIPAGYLSNGCRSWDTIMGDFYLREELFEYLAEGGSYEGLALSLWVDLPVRALRRTMVCD